MGVKKNAVEALRWLKEASAGGCDHATMLLGNMYEVGDGVPQDRVKAFHHYEAMNGMVNSKAFLMLHHCYEEGVGVPKNKECMDVRYVLRFKVM